MGQPIAITASNSPASPAKAREEFQPITRGATDGVGRGNPLKGIPERYHKTRVQISRNEIPSTTISLPFQCAWNKAEGKISILGGTYQTGVDGAFVDVDPLEATTGTHAYLCVKQNSDGDVLDANTILEVVSEAKDPTNLDAGNDFTEWSNILLGEVIGTGDSAYFSQRRHGNFTLTLWDINGYVARWPETVIGSIPPVPA